VTGAPVGPRTSISDLLLRYSVERPPTPTAGAAVTIVLRDGRSEPEVLLIERTTDPSDPASGQVALPGGHVAEEDGNLLRTALREMQEEVDLGPADLVGEPRYVGTTPARRFGVNVAVFASSLGPSARSARPGSPAEVAHVFWLPRSALGTTVRVERETSFGLVPVPATVHEGHVLWGFTRRVLRSFFELPAEDEAFGPLYAPHRSDPDERSGSPPPVDSDGRPLAD
jgi:8-oxo-dGTP pyrophosphatase MutT (NUDIX family)